SGSAIEAPRTRAIFSAGRMSTAATSCGRNPGWSLASAHLNHPLPLLLALAHSCASASDTAPLVLLTTRGAGGTCSCCRMSGGGTLVTSYGAHNAAHAVGT